MVGDVPFWVVCLICVAFTLVVLLIVFYVRVGVYRWKYHCQLDAAAKSTVFSYADREKARRGNQVVIAIFASLFSPKEYEGLFDRINDVNTKQMRPGVLRDSYITYRNAFRLFALTLCLFVVFTVLAVIIGNVLSSG